MSLQNKTIQRYRTIFPNDTLREISERTGIQITRIFRLLNGKTMKIVEFEAIERAIETKINENPNFSRFNDLFEQASINLTNTEIGEIADYIERKIANKKYARTFIHSVFEDAILA
jgi:hypothetical protein